MQILRNKTLTLSTDTDVVRARQEARAWAVEIGFSLVEQTKLVTAASEIARNTVVHGGGGEVCFELLNNGTVKGVRLVFTDNGPGIIDIKQAMTDGYTTIGGLGLGLGGAQRLVNEFAIRSQPGKGTRVSLTRWK